MRNFYVRPGFVVALFARVACLLPSEFYLGALRISPGPLLATPLQAHYNPFIMCRQVHHCYSVLLLMLGMLAEPYSKTVAWTMGCVDTTRIYIANFTCSARGKMCFVSVRALCSLWDRRCLPQVARCLMLGALCVVAVYAPIRTGYCDTCSGRGSFMLMPAAGGWRQCRDHLLVN